MLIEINDENDKDSTLVFGGNYSFMYNAKKRELNIITPNGTPCLTCLNVSVEQEVTCDPEYVVFVIEKNGKVIDEWKSM